MNNFELKRKLIEKEFSRMNNRQFESVITTKGPVLVLAGAGSGKTTVLINRIAYLIKYGDAYNCEDTPDITDEQRSEIEAYLSGQSENAPYIEQWRSPKIQPWQIMAITFTNKAAGELKERLCNKIENGGEEIWASTFHSTCARILRRYGERLGFSSHFTIYDSDDSKRTIKDCLKRLNIDEKTLPVREIMSEISNAKDSLIDSKHYYECVGQDYRKKLIAAVYEMYEDSLKKNDAMDFDDLIVNAVSLFEENEDVLEYYQNRFRYIMVDEYQDTNHAQYVLVKLLADKHKNICVVGDDDQSIYRFRGATVENILSFEKQYDNAKTVRLEQNYRSTSNILNAANEVISNNLNRKGKNLWTDSGDGEKVRVHTAYNESSEAKFVADTILKNVMNGAKYSDNAILYRLNSLSGTIEKTFARMAIPYKIIGGMRFYDRKEIKDMMSYLCVINNPADDLRLRRIINVPKRGIGETTVNNAAEIANQIGETMFYVISHADEYQKLQRSALKLKSFAAQMQELMDLADELTPSELYDEVLEKSGYIIALENDSEDQTERIENVHELSSMIQQYEEETDEPTLSEYLEEVALITDLDDYDEDADRVVMMTVHSAKGLEFPNVFLIGMEEGIFPGSRAVTDADIEEERRLAYVAITRAKRELVITNTTGRMLYGMTTHSRPSRFVDELPGECIITDKEKTDFSFGGAKHGGYGSSMRSGSSESAAKSGMFGSSADKFRSMTGSNRISQQSSKPKIIFNSGDRVRHKVFGDGMVLNATKMGNDYMLEIAFDTVGTKKVMANFAGVTKI